MVGFLAVYYTQPRAVSLARQVHYYWTIPQPADKVSMVKDKQYHCSVFFPPFLVGGIYVMKYVEVRKQLIGTSSLPLQCGLHGSTSSHQAGCVSALNPEPSHQPTGKLLKIKYSCFHSNTHSWIHVLHKPHEIADFHPNFLRNSDVYLTRARKMLMLNTGDQWCSRLPVNSAKCWS